MQLAALAELLLDSSVPPSGMSLTEPMLFSVKGGVVRGCLSGSLWLKSGVLLSASPAPVMSPGSAGKLRDLPAPGARSKFSFMTARCQPRLLIQHLI